MRSILSLISICIIILNINTSCRKNSFAKEDLPLGDTITQHSRLLTLIDYHNGIIEADIYNAWNSRATPKRYFLIDSSIPDSCVPSVSAATFIRVPVQSALVYSSVHTFPLEELGAGQIITGVADAEYFTSSYIKEGLQSGRIINVGNSLSPSLEAIMELSPMVALVSPYENSGHGVLDNSGIEVIDMADYMENSPLARAEWIKLLGVLTGRLEEANSIYNLVRREYTNITEKVKDYKNNPMVLTELPTSGIWYQPGGKSYMATLINDAGGQIVFPMDTQSGSIQLDIETIVESGHNADIWLIKSTAPITKNDILKITPLAQDITAFKKDNVWYTNTAENNFYDMLAFHPEKILDDFSKIIKSSRSIEPMDSTLNFYSRCVDWTYR